MRTMLLVVGAVLLSWTGAARAAGLQDMSLELRLPSTGAAASTALQTIDIGNPIRLMAEGAAEGGQADSGTRKLLSLGLSFVIGFGSGHFVLGDGSALLFLALDAGLLAGGIVLGATAFAMLSPGIALVANVLYLAYAGVRVWEFVDCLFKSGVLGGAKSTAAILPRGHDLQVGAPPFVAMAANGPSWRF